MLVSGDHQRSASDVDRRAGVDLEVASTVKDSIFVDGDACVRSDPQRCGIDVHARRRIEFQPRFDPSVGGGRNSRSIQLRKRSREQPRSGKLDLRIEPT